jgi:DNA-binding response OmpR family regulator
MMAKRVLIVDDEPFVVGVLQECFTRFKHGHAYEVTTAGSAADAFAILQREPFDLILLDNVLPGTGAQVPFKQGLDLLKRVRDLGVATPILMMTGAGDAQREAEALRAGATSYLHKPFDLRELDRVVALALAGQTG